MICLFLLFLAFVCYLWLLIAIYVKSQPEGTGDGPTIAIGRRTLGSDVRRFSSFTARVCRVYRHPDLAPAFMNQA